LLTGLSARFLGVEQVAISVLPGCFECKRVHKQRANCSPKGSSLARLHIVLD
jgi:hypothetical protein